MGEREIREIDAETFIKMFIAKSYVSEQVFINYVDFTGYLWEKYVTEPDVLEQIDNYFQEMIDDGSIVKVNGWNKSDKEFVEVKGLNGVYQITNKFDYYSILKDNQDYIDDITYFFYAYLAKLDKVNLLVVPKTNKKTV